MEQRTTKYPAESEVIKWLTSQVPQAPRARQAHMAVQVQLACEARLVQLVLWEVPQVHRAVLAAPDPRVPLDGRARLDPLAPELAAPVLLVPLGKPA